MALSGIHITFGYSASSNPYGHAPAVLPFQSVSSQTMASPGTSSISAPAAIGGQQPMLSISGSAAAFYVVGPAPDITNGPRRYFDPQFGREDIIVNPGDGFAWDWA